MSEDLKAAWLNAPDARLGPKNEALAWALRKAWFAMGKKTTYGMVPFVQEHLDTDVRPQTLLDLFSNSS